ncbi:type I restriction-modification system endonuclease [Joostella atrarenae]|uniref:Type I restriction-modification system endonuclease n=1 Tax=Joostella atrarenae TaxID=679257 RepID=A0ABS9J7R9_9FLAO|nr:type I restriction-modification system endonuclease [Joostella atrarenae]MCF8716459.1 type I restriction-modification system endonuclease [Joostella atrarenae]
MDHSKFKFLQSEYPELFSIAELTEKLIHVDPSSALAKARLFSEKTSQLIWNFEKLGFFNGKQVERINQLKYTNSIPDPVADLMHVIRKSGNKASHSGSGSYKEALFILKKCYQLSKWFFETYESDYLENEAYELPETEEQKSVEELTQQLEKLSQQVIDYESKISALNASTQIIEERKERSFKNARNIDKSEAETRALIDEQLRSVGWECDTEEINFKKNKSLPEKGKNKAIAEWPCEGKWADYALFMGTELYGIVEAKKYATDISTDLQQSKIYAEKVTMSGSSKLIGEWHGYKVPFLFSTNGRSYLEQLKTKSGIWFLDIRNKRNHPKALHGWYSPQGLFELYQRDTAIADERLEESGYEYLQNKNGLSLRYYQIYAIKAIEKKIRQHPNEKRSLLVMATGTGKTRTVLGLTYRLIKSDRFKRILFLTDRTLLAGQAKDGFQDNKVENLQTFAGIYQMEDTTVVQPDSDTRLHFATVQSMVKRLFYSEEPLPIDTYDCIIIDEAHRGYNLDKEIDEGDLHFKDEKDYVSQYKRVIEYFDAYIIGLTATPALHTTEIFGKPTHSYSYREAVIDGYLTDHEPPYLIKTKLSEEGIVWQKGEKPTVYNPETNSLEELAELEDELLIEIEQFNKFVITESFNREVIKQLVQELDPESEEKTLIFAVRDSHADMIVDILREEFANIGCDIEQGAIEKITGSAYDPTGLTKRLKNEKYPTIAVTVDLLTTGIDVPQITNLVFLRRVRSRILFEQMLGRATRKCDDIGKEYFRIYDAVKVYEALEDYTQMQTVSNPSISFQRLVEELDFIDTPERAEKQLQQIIAKLQRKKKNIEERQEEFIYLANGESPETLIERLKEVSGEEVHKVVADYASLWKFLDKKVYRPKKQLVSDHDDELIGIERGYGKAEKPEDYIEGFKNFIQENRNKIAAINMLCTRPSELDRASLKELKLLLDQEGYTDIGLNTAWKQWKNEDVAADIISFIRTMALDTDLVSHEDRIKNAVDKIRELKGWNKIQLKWIERFEFQLLKETILQIPDLNQEPFNRDGGYQRLNKIFENRLDEIITTLNENLYSA